MYHSRRPNKRLAEVNARRPVCHYIEHLADIPILGGRLRQLDGAPAGRVVGDEAKRVERGLVLLLPTLTSAVGGSRSAGHHQQTRPTSPPSPSLLSPPQRFSVWRKPLPRPASFGQRVAWEPEGGRGGRRDSGELCQHHLCRQHTLTHTHSHITQRLPLCSLYHSSSPPLAPVSYWQLERERERERFWCEKLGQLVCSPPPNGS